MAVVSINYLLEAGVHFGHQKRTWNPKMKEYIFNSRDDIYIIDLEKTSKKLEEAYEYLKEVASKDGKVLFVGTKKQAKEAIKECALKTENYFVSERWLGGTLTNFKTIRSRVNRLEEIEKMAEDGTFELLTKKEVLNLKKEQAKLLHNLEGIRDMKRLPDVLVIVDPEEEIIAIREAHKLNIPVIGIVDTNCDPDLVDYVIPGNDDAVRSITLLLNVLTNALCEVKNLELYNTMNDEDKAKQVKAETKENVQAKEEKTEVKEEKEVKETAKKEVKKETKKEAKPEVNLEKMTVAELRDLAKEKGLAGYSSLKKAELIKLIGEK